MNITGYYYLHKNGSLHYKKDIDSGIVADFRESDFVTAFWPINVENRESAWTILIESSALNADPERIKELAEKWKCNNADAYFYAKEVNAILRMDSDAWCATRQDFLDLQISPSGFGDNALHALATLAKNLGYKAQKMWGESFKDLLLKPHHI